MKRVLRMAMVAVGVAMLSVAPAAAQRHGGGHTSGSASHGFARGAGSRRGDGAPVGHAVPRGTVGPVRGNRPNGGYGRYGNFYFPGYYYGSGFGFGYYNPFWGYWGYGYPGYGYPVPYVVPAGVVTGGLRLEVQPDTAQVYVDGAYAGIVDDFNGHFHHLDMTPGPHRIDVTAQGYQTLTFDVLVQADHTTHYKGSLVPMSDAVR